MEVLVFYDYYNKVPQIDWLKQEKFNALKFWRLEVQDQVISMAMVPLKVLGKTAPALSLSFWWFTGIFGIPWLVNTAPWSVPSCSHGFLPVWVSVQISPSCKDTGYIALGTTLLSCDLILTKLIISTTTLFSSKFTLSYWRLGLQHKNVGVGHNSTHNNGW